MSLFGTNHSVQFGSVVYNLAGPENHRPQYLQTTIAGAILQSAPIVDTLRNSYLNGPGISLRSFSHWAHRSGLSAAVHQDGSILTLAQNVDTGVLASLMPALVTVGTGQTATIQSCKIDLMDFTHWADQYVAANYPASVGTAYTAAFDQTANVITVTFVDTTIASFTPTGLDVAGRYLYAAYALLSDGVVGSITTGSTITLGDPGEPTSMPSTTGWTSDTSTDSHVTVWEMTTYDGLATGGGSLNSTRQIMYQNATAGTYRIDTQTITGKTISPISVLIYKYGSGNLSVDALFKTTSNNGDFFPFIPLRINSQFVSPTYLPDIYTLGKKAIKKSINGKIDKMISDIGANSAIGNIFNAYVVFGVSLNTTEQSSRKYIYNFFQKIMLGQDLSNNTWQAAWDAANAQLATWQAWSAAQTDPTSFLYGQVEPPQPTYPSSPDTTLTIGDSGSDTINYTSTVAFSGVNETTGTGILDSGHKAGTVWLEIVGSPPPAAILYSKFASFSGATIGDHLRINWQVDETNWRYLDVYGLTHTQQLFRNQTVTVTASEALAGDENGNGFIIPLDQGIFEATDLVDATQMSTACAFIVFTTAVATKTNWYESGIFKILLIVVIIIVVIVVTYFTWGADLPAVPGLLGSAGSVGGALGLTGTAAAIAGIVVNAIAAIVLTQIITTVSTSLFGPKIGALVGAIASFVLLAGVTSYMNGIDLAANFTGMTLVTNLAKLTIAVGDGITKYIQASTQETLGKIAGVETAYTQDAKDIQTTSDALLGSSDNGLIDPLMFTDMTQIGPTSPLDQATQGTTNFNTDTSSTSQTQSQASSIETPELFLSRTLLTGTDLAGLSLDMLTDFATITLNTTLPI